MKIKEIIHYQADIKDGEYEGYYENGELRLKGNYVKGKMEGKWYGFHANGILEIISNYKAGIKNGQFEYFYENAQTHSIRIL